MVTFDLFTDLQWLDRISFKLERFKKQGTSKHVYACRCPYCGDSQRRKRLTRFYFYTKKGQLNFDCKNCGEHGSFFKFMREQCSEYFEEYKKDQMLKRFDKGFISSKPSSVESKKEKVKEEPLPNITKITGAVPLLSLSDNHPAIKYLKDRGFEEKQMERLLFSENFIEVARELSFDELSEDFPEDQRIVIPFYSEDGNVEMVQGRSIDPTCKMRYISIKTHEDVDKVFGKEHVDRSRLVYCVEGPLDSLFVDNCLATCDAALTRAEADVYIWDNQPRAKDIAKLMQFAIDQNKSIVIWPTSPDKKEDINDMINDGFTPDDIMTIIRSRTFKGLKAKLEFNKWKKV